MYTHTAHQQGVHSLIRLSFAVAVKVNKFGECFEQTTTHML